MSIDGVSRRACVGIVWYRLNINEGTAIISHEEPQGGDWENLKRVRNSKFILYEGPKSDSIAGKYFSCTRKVSNVYIHKPILCTFNEKMKKWIVFYPIFKDYDHWWRFKYHDVGQSISNKEEFYVWLRKNARKILKAFIDAHTEGVAHGDLSNLSNYVIVRDPDEKLKLQNFSIQRANLGDEDWKAVGITDVSEFFTQLQSMMPYYREHDYECISDILNDSTMLSNMSFTDLCKMLIGHPYLKSGRKRLQIFVDAAKVLDAQGHFAELQSITQDAKKKNVIRLPWNSGLMRDVEVSDSVVVKGMKETYRINYEGVQMRGVEYLDLIQFLRHVYFHAIKNGIFDDYDHHVTMRYPGLVSLVYLHCPAAVA